MEYVGVRPVGVVGPLEAQLFISTHSQCLANMVDVRACYKPVSKHSFIGVRSSKFRHVYGNGSKKEKSYDNVKITKNTHDSQFCAVNPKFIAIVIEVAGGGAFIALPIDRTGRVEFNASKVTGHAGPVLDVKWNPFNDNIIASCSDDCTVKLWHIPDGGLSVNLTDSLTTMRGHKRRIGYIEWHPTAENILLSAGFDYKILVWNVSEGDMPLITIDCHPDIIYSMSFNRDGSLIATTCKDKKIRVVDIRSQTVLAEGQCHYGTRASKVVFLGDSERLFTTGFSRHSDRQYAVWDQHDLSKPLRMETIDSSSGILFPYYDHDTKIVYLAGKGDGNIRYYEIVNEAPWAHYLNQYLSGLPQRGLGIMPKRGCSIRQCEIFRFYKLHTTKGLCEPVSMIVPRKSDMFQDDLFPDTAGPTPSLTAEEWLSGANKPPLLISMRTGVAVKTHKPVWNRPGDQALNAADRNNERKFMFLSRETVPDYRSLDDKENNLNPNGTEVPTPAKSRSSATYANSKSKSLPTPKMDADNEPESENRCNKAVNEIVRRLEESHLQQNSGNKSRISRVHDKQHKTSTNYGTKMQPIQRWNTFHQSESSNGNLLIDSNKYHSSIFRKEKEVEIIESPKSELELRKAYNEQCEEVKLLRAQLTAKDRRIKELEAQLEKVKSTA